VTRLSTTRWTLVHLAQSGDADAIRALCEKYRPAIVAYLAKRGLGSESEDVAQEVLLALTGSALERARSGAGRFRGLVFAVARNQLLKHLERQGAAKRGAGRTASLDGADPAEPSDPDATFDREWLANLVRSALARLNDEHPTTLRALQRFVLDGVPQAEVARELGLTTAQVKKLVFRGKRRVVSYLREEVWVYSGSSHEYEAELALLSKLLGLEGEKA
jgi:RNA polymerase sigma-70 factor (ECF subfamily)